MTDRAIFQGTVREIKQIVTRSVLQIVIEVPIENGRLVYAALGGWPVAGSEPWVAVARLDPKAAPAAPSEPEKPKFSLTRQAGIACDDPRFRQWLIEVKGMPESGKTSATVRWICGVGSRADFDKDPAAGERWRALWAEYQMEDKV